MRPKLSFVLAIVVVLFLGTTAPLNAKSPVTGEMDLQFNLAWPGPQTDIPDWVGTLTIDGDEYGMAFFLIGTGKPFAGDHVTGNASFFGEIWRVYDGIDLGFDEFGNLAEFSPGPIILWGYDAGMVSLANSKYHMNGSVEYAAEAFAGWLGRSVHMSGVIEWYDFGAPQYAPGVFRVN